MHARYTQRDRLGCVSFSRSLPLSPCTSVNTNDKEHIFSTFVCFVYVLPLFFQLHRHRVLPTNRWRPKNKIKAIYFKHSEIVWCDDGLLNFCFLSISFSYAFANVCLAIIVAVELRVSSISYLFIYFFIFLTTQHPNTKNQFLLFFSRFDDHSISSYLSSFRAHVRSIFTYAKAMHFQRLYS